MANDDTLDSLVKKSLTDGLSRRNRPDCGQISVLFDYLTGRLTDAKKNDYEKHLSECMSCLEQLDFATDTLLSEVSYADIPAKELMAKIRSRLGIGASPNTFVKKHNCRACTKEIDRTFIFCPHCGLRQGADTNIASYVKKNIWLFTCLFVFILSFIFKKYFMQFLILSTVFGLRWALDSINSKTLIMIYDAWKIKQTRETNDDSENRLNRRINR